MQLTPVDPYVERLSGPLSGARCLVTGASGFLGRNMISDLLAVGAEVHIVVHRRSQCEIPLGKQTVSHRCDLTSVNETEGLFESIQPEYVFHLATERGDSKKERDKILNVIFADRLIRASLSWRPKRVVVAQSSLEYGPHSEYISELAQLRPNTIHGATKAAATLLFQQAYHEYKLPIVMLRIFSIYGYWEPWKRLVPTTMRALLNGNVLPLTSGEIHRDFVFVTDVVEAFIRAALNNHVDGEIINICGGKQTSNDQLVQMIEEISGLSLSVDRGAYLPHVTDANFWGGNNEKALQLLGWSPRHTPQEGLSKTWEWFCNDAPR